MNVESVRWNPRRHVLVAMMCKGPRTINAADVGPTRDLISHKKGKDSQYTAKLILHWLLGWPYVYFSHSADESQEGQNSSPFLRSCFIVLGASYHHEKSDSRVITMSMGPFMPDLLLSLE